MDWHLPCSLLCKYSWMSQLLCPSMDHSWMDTLLPYSVQVSMDAKVTVPSMDHPWIDTFPAPFCVSIHGCQSYCAIYGPSKDRPWMNTLLHPSVQVSMDVTVTVSIHGPSVDEQFVDEHLPLPKYPWMPELLCPSMGRPWMNTLLPPSV